MEEVQQKKKYCIDYANPSFDTWLIPLGELPPVVSSRGTIFQPMSTKWKRGNSSDKVRCVRYRRLNKSYNPVLDIPEIFEMIISYVEYWDFPAAMHFCRALEFLGSTNPLELNLLLQKRDKHFTSRIGVMSMRIKCGMKLSGDAQDWNNRHCMNCMVKVQKSLHFNPIEPDILRCWECFNQRYKLLRKDAAVRLLRIFGINNDRIRRMLSGSGMKCHDLCGHLKSVRFKNVQYFLWSDVLEQRRRYKNEVNEPNIQYLSVHNFSYWRE